MRDDSERERRQADRGIFHLIFFFSLLFFALIGYMIYFIGWQAPGLMGNPYNARMEVFDNRILRGAILSSDGQTLAVTERGEDGTETRRYPFGALFAHAVGYTAKGKTGLESAANFYLMESHTNPMQQILNELTEQKSLGDNVVTTLHAGLQQAAAKALGERRGAVICMEPKSGRILAMVSSPGFDPNTISAEWESLVSEENRSGNLINRTTQGLYPPGSTFKTVMALEYLREHPADYADFRYSCDGSFRSPEDPAAEIHCYGGERHGEVDLGRAYALSCNTAFAKLGTEIDRKQLLTLTESLGFNQDQTLLIAANRSRFRLTEEDSSWTLMQTAIGQGQTLMTPLHNLLLTAAIANDGALVQPRLLERVETADGTVVKRFSAGSEKRLMRAEEAEVLRSFMRSVVSEGTASKLRTEAYAAAGKTGSAEYTEDGVAKTDAWFTGFAPLEEPVLAVTVLVEDGETGGRTAVPIARKVFDYWLLS